MQNKKYKDQKFHLRTDYARNWSEKIRHNNSYSNNTQALPEGWRTRQNNDDIRRHKYSRYQVAAAAFSDSVSN